MPENGKATNLQVATMLAEASATVAKKLANGEDPEPEASRVHGLYHSFRERNPHPMFDTEEVNDGTRG